MWGWSGCSIKLKKLRGIVQSILGEGKVLIKLK